MWDLSPEKCRAEYSYSKILQLGGFIVEFNFQSRNVKTFITSNDCICWCIACSLLFDQCTDLNPNRYVCSRLCNGSLWQVLLRAEGSSKSVFNIAPCLCLSGQNLTKCYLQSRVLYQNKEFAIINIDICLKKCFFYPEFVSVWFLF